MSQSQTDTDQTDESTDDQSLISPQAREEIEALVDSRIEDALNRADFATEADLDEIEESTASEIDGLRNDLDGLRADLKSLADRIPTEDDLRAWAVGAVDHLVGDDECDHDRHEAIRDDLRDFIQSEVESIELEQDADESAEDEADEDQDEADEDGSEWDGGDTYSDADSAPWGGSD